MSARSTGSASPAIKPERTPSETRASPSLQLDTPLLPHSATATSPEPTTAISSETLLPASSPPRGIPNTPILSQPAPYMPPSSADLAYLASLPTPTVSQELDSRYGSIPGAALARPTARAQNSNSTERNVHAEPSPASSTPPSIADTSPPFASPDQKLLPPYPGQRPPSVLPPNAVLSSASREWEGMTSQGVRVRRTDTWVVGQGWGRHMRVIEGLGPGRPRRSDTARVSHVGEAGTAECEEMGGVERHGTW
ncbi:MAG: hypothetical protein LQ340_004228 [Diploschistes diacapsis]|nr:MAG: hypothetical protein LQ340_004228 [Diploschistes diacapsis]